MMRTARSTAGTPRASSTAAHAPGAIGGTEVRAAEERPTRYGRSARTRVIVITERGRSSCRGDRYQIGYCPCCGSLT